MSQARRIRHFARIANCRGRLAWFMKHLLCVMQAGGREGEGEEMNKNFTYMKYSPEKMHTAEKREKTHTRRANKQPKNETCPRKQ